MRTPALDILFTEIATSKKDSRYISSTIAEYHTMLNSVKTLPNRKYLTKLIYQDFLKRLRDCHRTDELKNFLSNYLKSQYCEIINKRKKLKRVLNK